MAITCPRCERTNPDDAIYCFHDGVVVQPYQEKAANRLPLEFRFPSGRRCKSFDEFAQGCKQEWDAARDLLTRSVFTQFFEMCQRPDLVQAAEDARAHAQTEVGLAMFLTALPCTVGMTPKLEVWPRRIAFEEVLVGEVKTLSLTIANQGDGVLLGTLSVNDGQEWISLGESESDRQVKINAVREQVVTVRVHSGGKPARASLAQAYEASLTIATNGGVRDIPLRMDLRPHPFPIAPFQGKRSVRELASAMRAQPKVAVAMLERGDVRRWYEQNCWTYPVRGETIASVGGVQQYFEALGLSKPPRVEAASNELSVSCNRGEIRRVNITIKTPEKKFVYAHVRSDAPWLRPTATQVSGPSQATLGVDVDTNLCGAATHHEGCIYLEANSDQKLSVKVVVDIVGAAIRPAPVRKLPSVFVSHSSLDRGTVDREIMPILQMVGVRPWYSEINIRAAEHWAQSIMDGLNECDWFIVVLSENAAKSEWVKNEVHWAFDKRKGRILPLMINDCDPYHFHIGMARIQCIDFRTDRERAKAELAQFFGKTGMWLPILTPPHPA